MPTASIRSALRGLTSLGFIAISLLATPAFAQTPIQSQDTNISGVVAEITECKRADGVLTVRMRLRNTTNNKAEVRLISGRNYDAYYLTAASKKYFVLRDSDKTPLAPQADGFGNMSAGIEKGASYVWWAKFPAPPADVKKVSYFTPIAPPFDNIAITD
jgi:hypothetical protein